MTNEQYHNIPESDDQHAELNPDQGGHVNPIPQTNARPMSYTQRLSQPQQQEQRPLQPNPVMYQAPSNSVGGNGVPLNQGNARNAWYEVHARQTMLVLAILLVLAVFMSIIGFATVAKKNQEIVALKSEVASHSATINGLNQDKEALLGDKDDLNGQVESLTKEIDELKNGKDKMLVDVRNAYDKKDWRQTISAADALHEKYNGSDQDKEGQKLRAEAQKKIDEAAAAKKRQEEEKARRKAEEEARGYETGITYENLARTPDEFKGKKVKFYGKVVQVANSSSGSSVTIRFAVDGDYDHMILGNYDKSIVKSRILEDDFITIYGTSEGEYTYESVLGSSITLPSVDIAKIDQ